MLPFGLNANMAFVSQHYITYILCMYQNTHCQTTLNVNSLGRQMETHFRQKFIHSFSLFKFIQTHLVLSKFISFSAGPSFFIRLVVLLVVYNCVLSQSFRIPLFFALFTTFALWNMSLFFEFIALKRVAINQGDSENIKKEITEIEIIVKPSWRDITPSIHSLPALFEEVKR
jgi:hypothetical protein